MFVGTGLRTTTTTTSIYWFHAAAGSLLFLLFAVIDGANGQRRDWDWDIPRPPPPPHPILIESGRQPALSDELPDDKLSIIAGRFIIFLIIFDIYAAFALISLIVLCVFWCCLDRNGKWKATWIVSAVLFAIHGFFQFAETITTYWFFNRIYATEFIKYLSLTGGLSLAFIFFALSVKCIIRLSTKNKAVAVATAPAISRSRHSKHGSIVESETYGTLRPAPSYTAFPPMPTESCRPMPMPMPPSRAHRQYPSAPPYPVDSPVHYM